MRKVIHPRYPEYFIRDDGLVERRVDSLRRKIGNILTGRVLDSGYRQFTLVDLDGKRGFVRANRLVCEAFHGQAPSATHHSAHRDGNRLNSHPDNLYWATPKQNTRDAFRHGTFSVGENKPNAKMTVAIVLEIRSEYTGKRGELVKFAKRYGVGPSCIQKIVSMQAWLHVPGRSALCRRGNNADAIG